MLPIEPVLVEISNVISNGKLKADVPDATKIATFKTNYNQELVDLSEPSATTSSSPIQETRPEHTTDVFGVERIDRFITTAPTKAIVQTPHSSGNQYTGIFINTPNLFAGNLHSRGVHSSRASLEGNRKPGPIVLPNVRLANSETPDSPRQINGRISSSHSSSGRTRRTIFGTVTAWICIVTVLMIWPTLFMVPLFIASGVSS
jgi:hypothetical protein